MFILWKHLLSIYISMSMHTHTQKFVWFWFSWMWSYILLFWNLTFFLSLCWRYFYVNTLLSTSFFRKASSFLVYECTVIYVKHPSLCRTVKLLLIFYCFFSSQMQYLFFFFFFLVAISRRIVLNFFLITNVRSQDYHYF